MLEKYKDISAEELSIEKLNRYVLIDVRSEEEYKEGHLPSSRNIPMDELDSRLGELEVYKEKEVLLICRSGARSAMASEYLSEMNFKHVFNLSGGLLEWNGLLKK